MNEAQKTVQEALTQARAHSSDFPKYPMFSSIVVQLEYLAKVLDGSEPDRRRLADIMIGHYAVRELEETDPEFADILMKAQLIASKMERGHRL